VRFFRSSSPASKAASAGWVAPAPQSGAREETQQREDPESRAGGLGRWTRALGLGKPPLLNAEPATAAERDTTQLFRAIQQAKPGWQRQVFDEYHRLVRGLALKAFGPYAEVEEVIDDVFLSFFDAAHRVQKPEALRSYLVSITMNRIRTEIRVRQRRAKIYRLVGPGDELDRRASTDDPKAKAALIQLSHVVDDLDAEERAVYLLRFVEGLPLAEVAELLNMSEATAQRRALRAEEHVLRRVSRNALLSDYVAERTRHE
jgi:RNA polymerase sigma-70 factor, ECF subfamily